MAQQPKVITSGVCIMDPNNSTTAIPNTLKVNADGSINVDASGTSFSAGAVATAAAPSYVEGSTNALSQNLSGDLRTLAKISSATPGITSVVSSTAESSHVLKAGAGTLYGLDVTTGAAAGYVMLFNATSAPADGAVTPIKAWVVSANSSLGVSFIPGPPLAFSAGITATFSTTGPFTKTASSTAFFSGEVV